MVRLLTFNQVKQLLESMPVSPDDVDSEAIDVEFITEVTLRCTLALFRQRVKGEVPEIGKLIVSLHWQSNDENVRFSDGFASVNSEVGDDVERYTELQQTLNLDPDAPVWEYVEDNSSLDQCEVDKLL